jgi:predicted nucleic acid-binding protein
MPVMLPLFRRVQAGSLSLIVSVITEAELLVRPEREQDAGAIERIRDLLSENGIYVVHVDRRIARRAAALSGQSRFALADAIIIATAIETGCDAAVGNDGEWARKSIDIPFVRLDEIAQAK